MRHNPGRGIMAEFVRFRSHESVFGVEDIGVRKLNIISARRVERAVSAEAYVSRDGCEEALDGSGLLRGRRRRFRHRAWIEMRRQAIDLRGVEHAVGAHEAECFRRLLTGRLVDRGLLRAVEVDARLGGLALADLSAKLDGLAPRHPVA